MRLGDFINTAGAGTPAPTCPVSFKVIGLNSAGQQITGQANAVLVFISEKERQEAKREALLRMRELYKDQPIPSDQLSDEETYEILRCALRNPDDPRQKLGSTAELKMTIVEDVAKEIWRTYGVFLDEEFPPSIDAKTFAELVADAEKKSLAALLQSGGSSIRRALPSLVNHFLK